MTADSDLSLVFSTDRPADWLAGQLAKPLGGHHDITSCSNERGTLPIVDPSSLMFLNVMVTVIYNVLEDDVQKPL